jgi:hypothetical protein
MASLTQIAAIVNNTDSDVALLQMNDTNGYGTFRCPANRATSTDAGEGGVQIDVAPVVTWLLLGRGAFMMWDNGHRQIEASWFGAPQTTFVWIGEGQGHGKRITVTIEKGNSDPIASIHKSASPQAADIAALLDASRGRRPRGLSDIEDLDLSGHDLRRIDFRGISIEGADLRGATIADVQNGQLTNAARFEVSCRNFKDVKFDPAAIQHLVDVVNAAQFGGQLRVVPSDKLAAVDAILDQH